MTEAQDSADHQSPKTAQDEDEFDRPYKKGFARFTSSSALSVNQRIKLLELRKSRVRVVVTYAATFFLFGGGAVFIWLLLFPGELGIELKAGTEGDPDFVAINTLSEAKNLFMAILPIASSIIAFWFAGRKDSSGGSSGNTGGT